MTKAGIQSLLSAELSPPVVTGSVKQAEQNSPGSSVKQQLLAGFSDGDYTAISSFGRTVRTCLIKRDEKLVNNQWAAGHSILLFKPPRIVQKPMYLVEKYLNLIIPVFVLPHLCHHPYMATPPSLIQASLRRRWVPGHVPCQTDPKLFGNRINSIAFVAAKHQTPVWSRITAAFGQGQARVVCLLL